MKMEHKIMLQQFYDNRLTMAYEKKKLHKLDKQKQLKQLMSQQFMGNTNK